jgi:hypothetical protein
MYSNISGIKKKREREREKKKKKKKKKERKKSCHCALTEHHAMKAYWGSGCIAPLIL